MLIDGSKYAIGPLFLSTTKQAITVDVCLDKSVKFIYY